MKMRENRRFSEMRRECMNEPEIRELHAKCVTLGRSGVDTPGLRFTAQQRKSTSYRTRTFHTSCLRIISAVNKINRV